MKLYAAALFLISTSYLTATAHEGTGPEIDKDGNIIFHEELTHNIAPVMPLMATESGYCCVRLDVTKTGRVENTEVLYCSSPIFRDVSERTAPKITYRPRLINDVPVATKDVLEHFSFRLSNWNGVLIRNAEGYPKFDAEGEHVTEHYCRQYVA